MEINELIETLLSKRGLTSSSEISEFFHPTSPDQISLESSGLSVESVNQALHLIKVHLDADHSIAVYGDYDVDGMCSTAILWETLYSLSKKVFPHIPHRRSEGYGLSKIGIEACLAKDAKLIITVDNGIVAHDQIAFARAQGADVIIIDHHEPGDTLPPANVILHSTKTCAAGLTWFFVRELITHSPSSAVGDSKRGWGRRFSGPRCCL